MNPELLILILATYISVHYFAWLLMVVDSDRDKREREDFKKAWGAYIEERWSETDYARKDINDLLHVPGQSFHRGV